jgi:ABC-type multidrug transport system fused ATPase/permease subunit
MFKLSSEFKERYYNFIYKYFNLEKDIKLLPVDFNKPWYQILLDQKWNLSLQIILEFVQSVFSSLTPVILGFALFNSKIEYLYYFAIVYIILEIFNRVVIRYFSILIMQSKNSVAFSAYQYFLSVDPIYHTTKSSGQIISKIQKTTSDLEMLISAIVEVLLPTVIGFLTVVITIATFDYRLGIVGTISFILITTVNGGLNFINAEIFKKKTIAAEDKAKADSVETLQQNALIRASFASNEQLQKVRKSTVKSMIIESVSRQTFGVTRTLTRIIYAISTLLIGLIIYNLTSTNEINAGIGISLLLAYFNGSSQILRLGDLIRNIIQIISRQEDLFDFIRQFGVQTYPVLETDKIDENVALQIQQLEEKQKEYLGGKK